MPENVVPPIDTTMPQELVTPTVPPTVPPTLPHAHFSWWALITISFVFLAGISGFLFYQNQTLRAKLVVSPSPTSSTIAMASADPTEGWQTYTNNSIGFSIEYPLGWRKQDWENGVGFGPKEIGEDVILGISFYPKTEHSLSSILDAIGSQFPDRVVKSDSVIVDKTKVGRIMVTTPSDPDWYSESIIFETSKNFIVVGNGAMKNENLPFNRGVPIDFTFEKFYSTFKFTQSQDANKTLSISNGKGLASGKLCYPSEGLPKGEIVAKNVSTGKIYTQKFPLSGVAISDTFEFELLPGKYNLRYQAHASGVEPEKFSSGYYTLCTLDNAYEKCQSEESRKIIPTEIKLGEESPNILLCDFGLTEEQEKSF